MALTSRAEWAEPQKDKSAGGGREEDTRSGGRRRARSARGTMRPGDPAKPAKWAENAALLGAGDGG